MSEEIVCKDCRNEFTLTDGEIAFYEKNGLFKPRRCSECREKRRNLKKEEKKNA